MVHLAHLCPAPDNDLCSVDWIAGVTFLVISARQAPDPNAPASARAAYARYQVPGGVPDSGFLGVRPIGLA